MEGEAKPLETPEAFLKALGDSLKAEDSVDVDVAGILATHILKATLAQNGVAQAKDAILKLAVDRANLAKAAVING